MSIRADIDIAGKTVVMKADTLSPEYRALEHRLFKAEGGFGCQPNALGTKVFGTWVDSGEKDYVRRYNIERIVEVVPAPMFEVVGSLVVEV